MTKPTFVLYTFALSHYCENVRWALDHKRVPYEERSWAPVLHVFRTWRLPHRHLPVLRLGDQTLQESRDICDYLEAHFPEPTLVPDRHEGAVREVCEQARAVGEHVRRVVYHALGRDLTALRAAWEVNLSRGESRMLHAFFPLTRRMVFRGYAIDDEGAASSRAVVHELLRSPEARAWADRDYVVGDSFTLADITLASMLSPIVRPAEHPFYSRIPMGDAMDELTASFVDHPLMRWVRACYARHRARDVTDQSPTRRSA